MSLTITVPSGTDWERLYRDYADSYGMPMTGEILDTVWGWIQDTAGFLDDLYVNPAYRGDGAADAMLEALRREARDRGWPSVRWITREDNYRARGVYDRCARRTDWVTYQLDA